MPSTLDTYRDRFTGKSRWNDVSRRVEISFKKLQFSLRRPRTRFVTAHSFAPLRSRPPVDIFRVRCNDVRRLRAFILQPYRDRGARKGTSKKERERERKGAATFPSVSIKSYRTKSKAAPMHVSPKTFARTRPAASRQAFAISLFSHLPPPPPVDPVLSPPLPLLSLSRVLCARSDGKRYVLSGGSRSGNRDGRARFRAADHLLLRPRGNSVKNDTRVRSLAGEGGGLPLA